jgi:predicted RNA-binding protein with PIN domain
MPETTLYLFDGYNLLNAGAFGDRGELVDLLASYVAGEGARGVVVFDGAGEERDVGPLSVRFASHADDLLERLAAEHRLTERVCIVSSDDAVRRVSGQEVRKLTSKGFLADLVRSEHREQEQRGSGSRVGDRLDDETRARLERLRRGDR